MIKNFVSKGLVIALASGIAGGVFLAGCGGAAEKNETVSAAAQAGTQTAISDFLLFVKYDENIYYQTGETITKDEAESKKSVSLGATSFSDIPDVNTTAEEIEKLLSDLPSLSSNINTSVNVYSVVSDPDNRQLLVETGEDEYEIFER